MSRCSSLLANTIHGTQRVTSDPFAPAALRLVEDQLLAANVREVHDPLSKNVLALDLGTTMGWALKTSACVSSGSMNWAQRRRETRGERLTRLWKWLHMVDRGNTLSLLAYEEVQFMQKAHLAAHAYAQFHAVVLLFAARKQIPVVEVHTSTLKKAVTGSGKHPKGTGKAALMAAVRALGFTPDTQDECDAIAVLHWATRCRGFT